LLSIGASEAKYRWAVPPDDDPAITIRVCAAARWDRLAARSMLPATRNMNLPILIDVSSRSFKHRAGRFRIGKESNSNVDALGSRPFELGNPGAAV
jgi:hypothetical protein